MEKESAVIDTEIDSSQDWVALGNKWFDLRSESRNDNLEKSIECYQKALLVHTKEHSPSQWAKIQTNIGLVLGRQGKNHESLKFLEEAKTVFSQIGQENECKEVARMIKVIRYGNYRYLVYSIFVISLIAWGVWFAFFRH
jgi:tetratricopeptide (TPR) repeat protein